MNAEGISYYYLKSDIEPQPARSMEGALLGVSLALNRGDSVRDVVNLIFERVGMWVPCDRIGVALLDADGWLISKVVRSRYPIILGEGARGRLAGSSLEAIIRHERIRVIADLEAYARQHPRSETTAQLVAEGMRSSLTLPLIAKRKTIGVMFFTSTAAGIYDDTHIAFLRSLASSVAIALERAENIAALADALQELKTLDQLKTNFLSNLSHELRTPLSIVLSYLQTLDEEVVGQLSPIQHGLLREAITAASHLNALFNDLFDFTELSAGILHLDRVPLDLTALLRELAEEMRPAFEAAGHDLQVDLPADPIWVEADPPHLAKATCHLLDNARKFTPPPGKITLQAGAEGSHAWIEVKDNGIGIPLASQRRIFERFAQLDSDANRQYGGAGLGLALTRAIVEAQGGHIAVRSKPGAGATFCISLPLQDT